MLSGEEKAPADAIAPAPTTSPTPGAQFTLKVPEKSGLTDADAKEMAEWAQKNGIPADQAQKLLDRDAVKGKAAQEALAKQYKDHVNKTWDAWEGQLKSDKDFGGDRLSKTQDDARRALQKFADPDFAKELSTTAFGSHPGLIKMLSRVGASLKEDSPSGGSSAPPKAPTKSAPQTFYPSMYQK